MTAEFENMRFERLGHASVRIDTGDKIIYIDPWEKVIDEPRKDADIVFVTHDDFDHYSPEGIEKVVEKDTQIILYNKIDTTGLEHEVTRIGYGESTAVEGIEVETLPAYNRSEGEHVDDEGSPFHEKGEVIGLLIDINGTKIYYTSDTDFLPEHTEIRCDVFIPPIGGHYTMDRVEAVDFAESTEAQLVLPVHYNTFEAIETDVERFREDIKAQGQKVEIF